mgnify:CR=1 FL=1
MNKSIYTIGLAVLIMAGLYIAYKVLTTLIWLFFSGMLLLLTYPILSMASLTLMTGLMLTYCYLTEK